MRLLYRRPFIHLASLRRSVHLTDAVVHVRFSSEMRRVVYPGPFEIDMNGQTWRRAVTFNTQARIVRRLTSTLVKPE